MVALSFKIVFWKEVVKITSFVISWLFVMNILLRYSLFHFVGSLYNSIKWSQLSKWNNNIGEQEVLIWKRVSYRAGQLYIRSNKGG
jgi:hypothetical protein